MAKQSRSKTGTSSKNATKRGSVVNFRAKGTVRDVRATSESAAANGDQSEPANARNILTIETWNGRRIFALAAN